MRNIVSPLRGIDSPFGVRPGQIVRVLFIPSGSDSLITADTLKFKVREA